MDEKSSRQRCFVVVSVFRLVLRNEKEKVSNLIYVVSFLKIPARSLGLFWLITSKTMGVAEIPSQIYIYYSVIMHEFVFIYIFISSLHVSKMSEEERKKKC